MDEEFLYSIINWKGRGRKSRKSPTFESSSDASTSESVHLSQQDDSDKKRTTQTLDINSKMTYFDLIQMKEVRENIYNWFLDHASGKKKTLTELQVISFLRKLKDLRDWEIYDIFDIFDKNGTGHFGWNEFYLMLSLYTAYQSRQLTKFLYTYGRTMYKYSIDPVTKKLQFERFARLGYLLGIVESDILSVLNEFNMRPSDVEDITEEDYLLCYFSILSNFESESNVMLERTLYSDDVVLKKGDDSREFLSTSRASSQYRNEKCILS